MRVIAGIARSLPLKTVPGLKTRPTTDRIKETLFNMLQPYLSNGTFLDLFSGSGGIGIEALSRGAQSCVFIEKDREAVACMEDNLSFTKLKAHARVIHGNVLSELQRLDQDNFTCIFMDPPYEKGLEREVLTYCVNAPFCSNDTLFVVEASLDTDFDYLEELGYDIIKQKNYKTNKHLFLKKHKEMQIW